MMTETEKQPIYWNINRIYTFDAIPEGVDGVPNIFGGHAHSGVARERALRKFAAGDTSIIVFEANENGYPAPAQITDPALIKWPVEYRPKDEA